MSIVTPLALALSAGPLMSTVDSLEDLLVLELPHLRFFISVDLPLYLDLWAHQLVTGRWLHQELRFLDLSNREFQEQMDNLQLPQTHIQSAFQLNKR